MKRHFFLFLIFLPVLFFIGEPGQAEEKYPNRAIELVVPFDPGGSSDIAARIYSDELGRVLNTTITVVNRAGGGGMQGAAYVAKAKKDGYTLLAGSGSAIVNGPILRRKECPYDPLKDLIPLGNFVSASTVFAVRADSPFKTLEDVKEFARKNPGKIKAGIGGVDNDSHFNLMLFESSNKIKITAIPFKGGGESLAAILGGHVDMASNTLSTFAENIKAGKLRALCVVSKTRYPDFPDVPTTMEIGEKDVNLSSWQGVFVTGGVPRNVIDVLVPTFEKIFKNPELQKMAEKAQFRPDYMGPEEYRQFIEMCIQTVDRMAREALLIK
jgi:tripartite-type tricarboxylate transporter receptor subunit TctC